MLAQRGGHLHIGALATNRECGGVALFLRANQCLELQDVHDALVAQHHEHVILLKACLLRRAAVHHVSHEKSEPFRKTRLRGDFGRERLSHQAEVRHRLAWGRLRMIALVATVVVGVFRALALTFAGAIGVTTVIALAIAFGFPGSVRQREGLAGFYSFLRRPGFLSGGEDGACRDDGAGKEDGGEFGFHKWDGCWVRVGLR